VVGVSGRRLVLVDIGGAWWMVVGVGGGWWALVIVGERWETVSRIVETLFKSSMVVTLASFIVELS
jgi:hypothetical protein